MVDQRDLHRLAHPFPTLRSSDRGEEAQPDLRTERRPAAAGALARAIAFQPDIILFDEPLSNLDAKLREELRLELLQLQRDLGFSAIYVTHDQDEAISLRSEEHTSELQSLMRISYAVFGLK